MVSECSLLTARHEKAQMVRGVDQEQIVPLFFCEWPEKRVWKGSSRHPSEGGSVRAQLIDGARFVVDGSREPAGRDLNPGLHSSISQDAAQDHRTKKFANDPRCAVLGTSDRRADTFANVV